jgi:hypothetical protein
MIPSISNLSRWVFVLVAAASLVVVQADEAGVLSPSKRQEILDKGKQLLATKEIAAPEADPFYYTELGTNNEKVTASEIAELAAGAKKSSGPLTGRDKLQAIAMGLKPTFFMRGGEPTLLIGSKKISIGGIMTVTVEGAKYTLEIVSINPPDFTLLLNHEQFTRPIK